MKKKLLVFGLFALASFSSNAFNTGFRTVVEYGCHTADGTCFVTVDGPSINAGSCAGNSIRWDSAASPNGRNWLAMVMAAQANGKKVNFFIGGCFAAQPSYPTFAWGTVAN